MTAPQGCPCCGTDLDAEKLPGFSRQVGVRAFDGDGYVETWSRWQRYRCVDCGDEFAVLRRRVRLRYDADGAEVEGSREVLA